MNTLLKQQILRAFDLTSELYTNFEDSQFRLDLPELPSNTIGDQVWCIIGARESYTKAIKAGSWQGFSCSLEDKFNKEIVLKTLRNTQEGLDSVGFDELSDNQMESAFNLLEHEIQHHGQLIRFVYGNRLKFPESWNRRYTV